SQIYRRRTPRLQIPIVFALHLPLNILLTSLLEMKLFFLSLLLISSVAAKSEEEGKVVAECCAPNSAACCRESIDFYLALLCPSLESKQTMVDTRKCIQTSLYGQEDTDLLGPDHEDCCQVFEDDKDKERRCYKACMNALLAPSMSSS
ncbi:hypothetical protein PFISCL1PPCAC_26931, partial [Pristionchus fissidentatus]